MQQSGRTYIAIDLKSYYASVECMERLLVLSVYQYSTPS